MKRILLLNLVFAFAFFYHVQAQDRSVSGKVTAYDDGSALPGVNVSVKGATIGTTTDAQGKYQLTVPSNATLVFSFIGLTTEEVLVGDRTTIDMKMNADIKQLNEVVVTALGIEQQKKSLGYSEQTLKTKEIAEARETNIVNALSGKIAGVQITNSQGGIGSSSRIVIRGATSISGNNQPLFVVDGIPIDNSSFGGQTGNGGVDYGNAASDINPDNIESMTVLKGPNAAALYGTRAANGVILIRTKTGKGTKGIGISYNGNATFETPFILPEYQNDYGQGNGGTFSFTDGAGSGTNDGADESWGPRLDGRLLPQFDSPLDANGNIIPTPWVAHPNNWKDFFEVGHTISNNVAVYGSTEKANFRLSYTGMDQKGILPNTGLKRNTVNINGGLQLTSKLSATASVTYTRNNGTNRPSQGYDAQNVIQQFNWFGRQVDVSQLKDYKASQHPGQYTSGDKFNWNYNYHNNPYFTLNENINSDLRDRITGNIALSYKLADWLTLTGRSGNDFYNERRMRKRAVGDIDSPNGSYSEDLIYVNERNTDFLLTAIKPISEDFTSEVSVGGNQLRRVYEGNSASAPELAVPGIYTLANSSVALRSESYKEEKRINSLYGSAQFGFRNYAFLNLTGRNDWSSTLPTANNSFFYPSVNVSLVLTEALGIQSKVLSFAKIRGGWAKVGKDTNPLYLKNTYPFNKPFGTNATVTVSNTLLNPNLKPETTTSTEVGAELKFLDNRVGLEATYYNSNSVDQILAVDITPTTGFTRTVLNAGKLNNKGIELVLNATPIKTAGGFTWDVTVNFARNRGVVVELDKAGVLQNYILPQGVVQTAGSSVGQLAPNAPDQTTFWGLSVEARVGERYGQFVGNGLLRDASGNLIVDAAGRPQRDPVRRVLGNYTPDWTGGISNSLSYKGVSFSFLIDTKQGGDIFSVTNGWGNYAGVLKTSLTGREEGILVQGVKADGTANTTVVSAERYFHRVYNVSSVAQEPSIYDASFIKLREAKIGYSLPKALLSKTPFTNVSLSIVGRNLWLIKSHVPNIDPETSFSNGNAQGLEFGQIPTTRSIGFNLNLTL